MTYDDLTEIQICAAVHEALGRDILHPSVFRGEQVDLAKNALAPLYTREPNHWWPLVEKMEAYTALERCSDGRVYFRVAPNGRDPREIGPMKPGEAVCWGFLAYSDVDAETAAGAPERLLKGK